VPFTQMPSASDGPARIDSVMSAASPPAPPSVSSTRMDSGSTSTSTVVTVGSVAA
jgi:hypothetical protein